MRSYAANTGVTEDRSRAEIERMLMRYGADEFGYVTRRTEGVIAFMYRQIRVQMSVPIPDRGDRQFTTTPARGTERSEQQAFNEWQKEVRRRWRSLCLVIKALLVGVDDGVLSFEQAFMPYIVWGNGLTTSEMLLPHIQQALEGGEMPKNLKQLPVLPVHKEAKGGQDAPEPENAG